VVVPKAGYQRLVQRRAATTTMLAGAELLVEVEAEAETTASNTLVVVDRSWAAVADLTALSRLAVVILAGLAAAATTALQRQLAVWQRRLPQGARWQPCLSTRNVVAVEVIAEVAVVVAAAAEAAAAGGAGGAAPWAGRRRVWWADWAEQPTPP
jgi:hypothetical protein